ncbi:MAG: DUF192 domain-containing protein [Chloroflexota bacterium]|nr:DUF192 domain-containing protein [Chloroflexota bacterium]
MAELVEIRRSDGNVVARRAKVADTFGTRLRGMMGRREFGPVDGLALAPVRSVHKFFMRMAIDVLFVDEEGRVLETRRALPPRRLAAGGKAVRQTLELPDGTIDRLDLQPGDRLIFGPIAS